jgi:hypothetical protein
MIALRWRQLPLTKGSCVPSRVVWDVSAMMPRNYSRKPGHQSIIAAATLEGDDLGFGQERRGRHNVGVLACSAVTCWPRDRPDGSQRGVTTNACAPALPTARLSIPPRGLSCLVVCMIAGMSRRRPP